MLLGTNRMPHAGQRREIMTPEKTCGAELGQKEEQTSKRVMAQGPSVTETGKSHRASISARVQTLNRKYMPRHLKEMQSVLLSVSTYF